MAAEQPWPNPVEYEILGKHHHVYQTKAQKVNDLRQHLIDVWAGVEQNVIGDGIDQWRRCFHVSIRATGVHFDYSVWHALVKTLLTVIN